MQLKKQIYLVFGGTAIMIVGIMLILQMINQRVYYAYGKLALSNHAEQRVTDAMVDQLEDLIFILEKKTESDDIQVDEYIDNFIINFRAEIESLKEATEAGKELAVDKGDDEGEEGEESELQTLLFIEDTLAQMDAYWSSKPESERNPSKRLLDYTVALYDPVVELNEDALNEYLEEYEEVEKLRSIASVAVWWITILSGIYLVGMSINMTIGLSRPIAKLHEATKHISEGKWDFRIQLNTRNELGDLAASFNDMSERLSETTVSLESVEAIIESMGCGIVVLDHNNRIRQLNAKTKELLNVSRPKALGMHFQDFVVSEDPAKVIHFDYKGASMQEFNIIAEGNSYIPVGAIVTRFDKSKETNGTVIVLQDLRAIKESEEALVLAKEQAEAANQMKTAFLANMSHEIRTPMNGVNAVADLLLDTPLNRDQLSFVNIIKSSSETLLDIINELLDFSKIEAGKMDLNVELIPIWKVIEGSASMFSMQAHKNGLELLIEIDPELPQKIYADPVRLRQVIINLLGNALKFTTAGHIKLKVSCLEKGDDQARLHFEIIDTGIGIDPEDLDSIFENFKQLDSGLARKSKGTGLGLSICNSLLELMGSRLIVESEPDVGSKFHFELDVDYKPSALTGVEILAIPEYASVYTVSRNITEAEIIQGLFNQSGYASTHFAELGELLNVVDNLQNCYVWLDMESITSVDSLHELLQRMSPGVGKIWVAQKPDLNKEPAANIPDDSRIQRVYKPLYPTEFVSTLNGSLVAGESTPVISSFELENYKGKHALIVDDHGTNRKIASLVLEKIGLVVETAADAKEAFEHVETKSYDYIFMDIQMPEIDGFEASERIREIEKTLGRADEAVIIACTAHAVVGYRELCQEHGMNGYIPKPIKLDALKSELLAVSVVHADF